MNIYQILEIEEDNNILEIRLRVNKPIIILKRDNGTISDRFIDINSKQTCNILSAKTIKKEYLEQLLNRLLRNSIYLYDNQLKKGFFTIQGGHRVGIIGEVNIENNEIKNFRNITSMNIRIAHELKGCSNYIMKDIIKNQIEIYNTLIVSPPMCGKTTMLRDIVRNVSNGYNNLIPQTVSLIDERNEISATYDGVSQMDVGIRTDVLVNVEKVKAIEILIRSMNPRVIALDEIGMKDDIKAIEKAMCMGVKFIATMHANTTEEVKSRIINIYNNQRFEKIIYLSNFYEKFSVRNVETYV